MTKRIAQMFLQDRLVLILFYLLNMACIIGFFHLIEPVNREILYPFSIGLFLLLVYLAIDFARYYQTAAALSKLLNNEYAEIKPHTEEQKRFQALIEKTVEQHTREQNETIRQNKERYYFLSHWMHYLKTPVSVIELILAKEEKSEDALAQIQQENRRLHAALEQGLSMIRVDSIENDLDITSVDLLSAIRNAINARKRECIHHSIYPSIECEGESAFIATDAKWNSVLLDQIISNAIKYSSMKPGTKKLTCTIEQTGQHVTLSISDEGIGIPDYDLERVFQPFFTGENGRKVPNSSGIGLYLCKKITDMLGQTIAILSDGQQGTTVTIRYAARKRYLTKL